MSDSPREVRVLAVSQFEQDHTALRGIFGASRWKLDAARSVREAGAYLACRPAPVILCERNLPDGTWTDILKRSQVTGHPSLVIVMSHTADDHLWTEVLCRGGYQALSKPLRASDVLQAISIAWRQSRQKRVCAASAAA